MSYNAPYDVKYLVSRLVWLIIVLAMMKVTGGAGFLIAVPMMFGALIQRKTESLFFWLLVTVCTLIANPNIVNKGAVYAYSQRASIVVLGGSMTLHVFGQAKHRIMKPFLFMLVYVAFMMVPSAVGWCPMISFLKLFLFTVVYMAYFGVSNQVAMRNSVSEKRIRSTLLAVACLFIFGSVALVPFPAISQMQPERLLDAPDMTNVTSLFMGMTNHSQCLGPVISSISVILFADMLFSVRRLDKLYVALLACCPYLIYKTSSRTGMGAFILGMVFVVYYFMKARGVESRWKSRITSLMMLVVSVGAIGLMCSQVSVRRFALKHNSEEGEKITMTSIMSSRQGLIDSAMENMKEKPLIGNGFQVSSEMQGLKVGLRTLSAPIEKGVWYAAVLEEGGVIGFVIFVTFLLIGIFGSIKKRAYSGAACLFVCMLTNFGEFTFFSMSYAGGFIWAMVFVGLSFDARRLQNEKLQRMGVMW